MSPVSHPPTRTAPPFPFHPYLADFLALSTDGYKPLPFYLSQLKKLFSSGRFFFCVDTSHGSEHLVLSAHNLTRNVQDQFGGGQRWSPKPFFCWSYRMWQEVERHGIYCPDWLLTVIRGAVEIRTVFVGAVQAKVVLVSRLACGRTGRRFLTRGVDDEGNAANFVESEQAIFVDGHVTSVLLTRGSVPVFWGQPGLNVGSHKVKILRGFEATQPAFDRHLDTLLRRYGEQAFVSLLSKKEGEHYLESAMVKHLSDSPHDVPLIQFDVHQQCRGGKRAEKLAPLLEQLAVYVDKFGIFVSSEGKVVRKQTGALRFNCLDCLDRTNFVQGVVADRYLDNMLSALWKAGELPASKARQFHETFEAMWQRNGDNISRCITGTGAISGGTKTSKLKDVQRSVTRTIKNNFMDSSVQEVIDILLGKHIEGNRDEYFLPDPSLREQFDGLMLARLHE